MGFSLALTPVSRHLALRIGAIDKPGARRIHTIPTPRLGGPGLVAALMLALLCAAIGDHVVRVTLVRESVRLAALAIAALMVTAVGAVDDVKSVKPMVKLIVEIAAAVIAVEGGYRIDWLLGMHLQWLSFPVSVLFIVTAVNAVNMIDGLDGLAAGLCLIITSTLFLLCLSSGEVESALLLAALCGALMGFLPYNFHPARVFLGDSGALLLGFLVAISAISTSHKMAGAVTIAAPFLALGLPLAELIITTLRRSIRAINVVKLDGEVQRYNFSFAGRPALFSADRDHIHHRLLSLGISHRRVVLLLYSISVATCAAAFVIASHEDRHQGAILAGLVIAAVAGVRCLGYREFSLLKSGLLLPLFDSNAIHRKMVQVAVDLGFIGASYVLAFAILHGGESTLAASCLSSLPIIVAVQAAAFGVSGGLYRRSYRHAGMDDLLALAKALALAIAAGWIATVALAQFRPPPGVLILDAYLLATMVLGSRISFRLLDHLFEREQSGARRVLIYGAGRGGAVALYEIKNNPALAMTAVGFLDDDPRKRGLMLQGVTIHHPRSVSDMIRAREFDLMVIASGKIKAARMQILGEQCRRAGVAIIRFEINWQTAFNAPARTVTARRLMAAMQIHSAPAQH